MKKNAGASDFAGYLQRMVNLDAIEKMTTDLDRQLQGSKKKMSEIQAMFDTLPAQSRQRPAEPEAQEDFHQFLDAEAPNLVLPGMEVPADVDFDSLLASIKACAEAMKTDVISRGQPAMTPIMEMKSLELDQYAASLDQLKKRLANLKLTKSQEVRNRNPELEEKMTQLCNDVNSFTQMVQMRTKLNESNENWAEASQENYALVYDDLISKLLAGINEVTFLLQNKK